MAAGITYTPPPKQNAPTQQPTAQTASLSSGSNSGSSAQNDVIGYISGQPIEQIGGVVYISGNPAYTVNPNASLVGNVAVGGNTGVSQAISSTSPSYVSSASLATPATQVSSANVSTGNPVPLTNIPSSAAVVGNSSLANAYYVSPSGLFTYYNVPQQSLNQEINIENQAQPTSFTGNNIDYSNFGKNTELVVNSNDTYTGSYVLTLPSGNEQTISFEGTLPTNYETASTQTKNNSIIDAAYQEINNTEFPSSINTALKTGNPTYNEPINLNLNTGTYTGGGLLTLGGYGAEAATQNYLVNTFGGQRTSVQTIPNNSSNIIPKNSSQASSASGGPLLTGVASGVTNNLFGPSNQSSLLININTPAQVLPATNTTSNSFTTTSTTSTTTNEFNNSPTTPLSLLNLRTLSNTTQNNPKVSFSNNKENYIEYPTTQTNLSAISLLPSATPTQSASFVSLTTGGRNSLSTQSTPVQQEPTAQVPVSSKPLSSLNLESLSTSTISNNNQEFTFTASPTQEYGAQREPNISLSNSPNPATPSQSSAFVSLTTGASENNFISNNQSTTNNNPVNYQLISNLNLNSLSGSTVYNNNQIFNYNRGTLVESPPKGQAVSTNSIYSLGLNSLSGTTIYNNNNLYSYNPPSTLIEYPKSNTTIGPTYEKGNQNYPAQTITTPETTIVQPIGVSQNQNLVTAQQLESAGVSSRYANTLAETTNFGSSLISGVEKVPFASTIINGFDWAANQFVTQSGQYNTQSTPREKVAAGLTIGLIDVGATVGPYLATTGIGEVYTGLASGELTTGEAITNAFGGAAENAVKGAVVSNLVGQGINLLANGSLLTPQENVQSLETGAVFGAVIGGVTGASSPNFIAEQINPQPEELSVVKSTSRIFALQPQPLGVETSVSYTIPEQVTSALELSKNQAPYNVATVDALSSGNQFSNSEGGTSTALVNGKYEFGVSSFTYGNPQEGIDYEEAYSKAGAVRSAYNQQLLGTESQLANLLRGDQEVETSNQGELVQQQTQIQPRSLVSRPAITYYELASKSGNTQGVGTILQTGTYATGYDSSGNPVSENLLNQEVQSTTTNVKVTSGLRNFLGIAPKEIPDSGEINTYTPSNPQNLVSQVTATGQMNEEGLYPNVQGRIIQSYEGLFKSDQGSLAGFSLETSPKENGIYFMTGVKSTAPNGQIGYLIDENVNSAPSTNPVKIIEPNPPETPSPYPQANQPNPVYNEQGYAINPDTGEPFNEYASGKSTSKGVGVYREIEPISSGQQASSASEVVEQVKPSITNSATNQVTIPTPIPSATVANLFSEEPTGLANTQTSAPTYIAQASTSLLSGDINTNTNVKQASVQSKSILQPSIFSGIITTPSQNTVTQTNFQQQTLPSVTQTQEDIVFTQQNVLTNQNQVNIPNQENVQSQPEITTPISGQAITSVQEQVQEQPEIQQELTVTGNTTITTPPPIPPPDIPVVPIYKKKRQENEEDEGTKIKKKKTGKPIYRPSVSALTLPGLFDEKYAKEYVNEKNHPLLGIEVRPILSEKQAKKVLKNQEELYS